MLFSVQNECNIGKRVPIKSHRLSCKLYELFYFTCFPVAIYVCVDTEVLR